MSNAEKISIIGAGSAQFSMGIVRDACLTEGLQGSTITFMDVDSQRLDTVYNLAERYANELGSSIQFEKTTDRIEALEDSSYVINTALAGGHAVMERERSIQEENGYYRGIAVHAPYRQLQLMEDVVKEMEKACPDAVLLQSANPLPEGCTLMTRSTDIEVIGLCHGHFDYQKLANILSLDKDNVQFEAPGINHCIWMTEFCYEGQDVYPLLDRWIDEDSEEYWKSWKPDFEEIQLSPAAIDLYRLYGLMPIGDTCRASWPEAWWYHTDDKTKERWWGQHGGFDGEKGWQLHLEHLNKRLEQIADVAHDPKKKVTDVFPPEKSIEQLVPIIDARMNNVDGVFQVNIPNNGVIAGLPNDFVVEVPAYINSDGVQRESIQGLPETVMLGAIYPRWLLAERMIASYKSGDKRFLQQVYLSDHKTKTREQAERTIERVVEMEGNEMMYDKFTHFQSELEMQKGICYSLPTKKGDR